MAVNPVQYELFFQEERKRQTFEKLLVEWQFSEREFSLPSEAAGAVKTPLLSVRGIVAYMTSKRASTDTRVHRAVSSRWASALDGVRAAIEQTDAAVPGAEPLAIRGPGVRLPLLRKGFVELDPLCGPWPTLPQDWEAAFKYGSLTSPYWGQPKK